MPFLIGVLLLISFILILYFIITIKLKRLSKKIFGTTSISKIITMNELLDEDIPKSLSSLDSLYLENIQKDFPDSNINELKSMVEENIINYLNAIEKKDIHRMKTSSAKIKSDVLSKIKDLSDSKVTYKNIKFHKTVVSKYENKDGVATIYFGTAFEYLYKKDKESFRKKQDRIITECVYVIDSTKVGTKLKALGLNCPNCGAPIQSLKHKKCSYCNSGVVDLITRSFVINNMESK